MADSKDNVKVAIRVRPLNHRETAEANKKCISINQTQNSLSLDAKPEPKVYYYDYVADESESQSKIFEEVGKPIANSCLSGYNGTIFAYGQTGAGKTFTIQGLQVEDLTQDFENSASCESRGLLPRCFEYLFSKVEEETQNQNTEFLIKCSFLEIYQEQVMDLLNPNSQNLQLREDIQQGVYVDGLIEEPVKNVLETYDILRIGAQNRHVGSTSMNKESSRSHSVFTLVIESKQVREGMVNIKSSRFHLIDLAGSERQRATDAAGQRLKEAGKINKSLSALGNVINSLVDISEGKSRHVHYRDSKLTFLLKDSLGGNSKTYIIANVSPSVAAYGETLSTLKFAARAKQIKNKAVVNEDTSGTISILKYEIKKLKDQLAQKKTELCPKCSDTQEVTPRGSIGMNDRAIQLELLLEHNIRLRQDSEKSYLNNLKEKDTQIQALKSTIQKFEKKMTNDKMVIKFRDASIAKLQGKTTENQELENLRKENQMLREQLESPPSAAKLFVENEQLKQQVQNLQKELEEAPESSSYRLQKVETFTDQVCQHLKESASEREQMKEQLEELKKNSERRIKEAQELAHSQFTGVVVESVLHFLGEESESHRALEQENEILRQEIETLQRNSEEDLVSAAEEMLSEKTLNKEELNEEIEVLKSACKEKQEDISKLVEDKTLLQETIVELRKQLDYFRDNLSKIEKFDLVEQELKCKKDKVQDLEFHLENSQRELEDFQDALEYTKSQMNDLEVKFNTKSQALDELTQKSETLKEELKKTKTKVKHFEQMLLQKEEFVSKAQLNYLQQLQEKQASSCKAHSDKDFEIENLKNQLESKQAKLDSLKNLESELSKQKDLLEIAGTENKNLKELIKEKIDTIEKLKDPLRNPEFSKLTQENESLSAQLNKYEEKISSITDSYEALLSEYQNLTKEQENLKEKLETTQNNSDQLQTKLTQMKNDLNGALDSAESLKDKVKYYKEQYGVISEEHENLKFLNSEYTLKNQELVNELSELKQQNQELQENCQSLNGEVTKAKKDKETRVNELRQEIKLLEEELHKVHDHNDYEEYELKSSLQHYKELSMNLSQKNAEATSEIAKLRERFGSGSQAEDELNRAKATIKALREENMNKMEILKNTNKNILATKKEINMWKNCIDEKNEIINELRSELRKKNEEMLRMSSQVKSLSNCKDGSNEDYLKEIIEIKDKELRELKEKGQEYYSQADEALESQRKEIELLTKRCSSHQGEIKRLKDELKSSFQDREAMLEEIKRLRQNTESKFAEKTKPFKLSETLNKENDKSCSHVCKKNKLLEKYKEENHSLKVQNSKIAQEVKVKAEQVVSLQKKLSEFFKKFSQSDEQGVFNQLYKQSEEIQNLTEGLTKITDYVFSLPIVTCNPEETNIVDSTIKAISQVYEALSDKGKRYRSPGDYFLSSLKPGQFLSPSDKGKYGYK